jgi:hypothetical protein
MPQGARERSGAAASGSTYNQAPERMLPRSAKTTMTDPHLPTELLDHIVDILHDTKDALRNCCLVSKSWIPRTRRHLFADVALSTTKHLESWKQTFPDPSTSPAHYTNTLSIDCSCVTAADVEVGGWMRGFSRVVHLDVGTRGMVDDFDQSATPLVPFHGLSLTIKSLRVVVPYLPPLQIFNLIFSLPLLEDLALFTYNETSASNGGGFEEHEMPIAAQPSIPPMFTGSLKLYLRRGMKPIIRQLLSLSGGLHFWKLTWTWLYEEDFPLMMALVEGCSHTIESLDITCNLISTSIQHLRPH